MRVCARPKWPLCSKLRPQLLTPGSAGFESRGNRVTPVKKKTPKRLFATGPMHGFWGLLEEAPSGCLGNGVGSVIDAEDIKDVAQFSGQGCVAHRKSCRYLVGRHAVRYQS